MIMGQATPPRGSFHVEMIPLVNPNHFQDDEMSLSVGRHASPVNTRGPYSPERWTSRSSEGECWTQSNRSKRGEVKDPLIWGSSHVNVVRTEEGNLFAGDNTPMLPLSSKTRVNPSNLVTNADIAHLRRKVEQMEQNLQKKELQLQAAEEKAQQIMQLNLKLEKLERQIQLKDEAHRKLECQLYERQCELVSLQSSIKRAEVNLQASNMKVERLGKVLTDILYQVGDLISAVQNNSKTNSEHNQAMINRMSCLPNPEEKQLEAMRTMYLEALRAAQQNPTEHTISVVSKLREELQHLARCPFVIPDMITSNLMVKELAFQLFPLC